MTIEELKQHCIKTIKMSEAIESIPNVKITDSRSLQEHKMVLSLIEAWEKVRKEIKSLSNSFYNATEFNKSRGLDIALEIIDEHLKEISE